MTGDDDGGSRSGKQQRTARPDGPALVDMVAAQLGSTGEHDYTGSDAECAECDDMKGGLDKDAASFDEENLAELFDRHVRVLEQRAFEQRRRCELTCLVRQEEITASASNECVSFERFHTDKFAGDARLRTVRRLLGEIDKRGFERSNHQVRFHDAFIRACSRVFYREEWSVHKAMIMRHNSWASTPSEIMISTPRRFGKVR